MAAATNSGLEEYIRDLQKVGEAPVRPVDNSRRLETYINTAFNLWAQCKCYREDHDTANLYILLWRFTMLYSNVIRKHNAAKMKQHEARMLQLRRLAAEAMDELETLQNVEMPLVYEAVTRQEEEAAAAAAAAAAASAAAGPSTGATGADAGGGVPAPMMGKRVTDWRDAPVPSIQPLGGTTPSDPPTYPGTPTTPLMTGRLRQVILPRKVMDDFLVTAGPNLARGIEWCAILAGTIRHDCLHITHVLVPRQTGTADTCSAENEDAVFEYQWNNDLVTLGWIHTHPHMDAFLSSVDLHTHAAYQTLLEEAIAVVCSPHKQPTFGVFRVTTPALSVLQGCRQTGFHEHIRDGRKIPQEELFEQCPHVTIEDSVDFPTYCVSIGH